MGAGADGGGKREGRQHKQKRPENAVKIQSLEQSPPWGIGVEDRSFLCDLLDF